MPYSEKKNTVVIVIRLRSEEREKYHLVGLYLELSTALMDLRCDDESVVRTLLSIYFKPISPFLNLPSALLFLLI